MEFNLWCDESTSDGAHYSDFYGGILVRSVNLTEVRNRLNKVKNDALMRQELKWSKITSHYTEIYISIVSELFNILKEDKAKIRIMFRQSAIQASNLSKEQKEMGYHLLYYQFIKHAFGFRYSNKSNNPIFLRPYFDRMPNSKEKNQEFKHHIFSLQHLSTFEKAKIQIRAEDITEVDSKKHIELQCLDIILGAIAFRLNDLHKVKPAGQSRRGKRTLAKEKVFKHISQQIRSIYPNFNIGISTGKQNDIENIWKHPYRHWRFVPKEFTINEDKFK